MKYIKYIENIKRSIEEIEGTTYWIVNNIHGKNTILLSNRDNDKVLDLKSTLENNYFKVIQNIIILTEELKNDFFVKEIMDVCNKNDVYFGGVGYNSWKNNFKTIKFNNSNIISGYSFKGGVGRSQTIAFLSYLLYSLNKKVVVFDCDFEAPGISDLLTERPSARTTPGILDYLIDMNLEDTLNLNDYSFSYDDYGKLIVFPSGIRTNEEGYINKLSKISFGGEIFEDKMLHLIGQIQEEMNPDYIFIDLRAGISELNGNIMKNISNKNILFFGSDNQSLLGLKIISNKINLKNSYLVNSLIRYQGNNGKMVHKKFIKEVKEINPDYSNRIIALPYINEFLSGEFKDIKNVVEKSIVNIEEKNVFINTTQFLGNLIDDLGIDIEQILF